MPGTEKCLRLGHQPLVLIDYFRAGIQSLWTIASNDQRMRGP